MKTPFTPTQTQRLAELDAEPAVVEALFEGESERDACFRERHCDLVAANRARLERLRCGARRPALRAVEALLTEHLTAAGFTEVATPTLLAKGLLSKMGIEEEHPLYEQVYWVSPDQCLRPMLAPNLYHLMGHRPRHWPLPLRLFEIGSCFRRESKGARHLSEFTMLNAVEMGVEGAPQARLEAMIQSVLGVLGLPYTLSTETSEVYGNTTDVLVGGLEVASAATGPHPLDRRWNVADSWAGFGLGLERVVMLREGFHNIRRVGRSLIYLDGARLNA
jgi:phenylalanyl-tRNA synthetase alpha chain